MNQKQIYEYYAGSGARPVILWLKRTTKFELYACDYVAKDSTYMIENNITFNQCDISQTLFRLLF